MVFNALCGRLCGGIGHWYLFKLTAGGHAKHLSHRLQSCLKITLQKVHHKVETVTVQMVYQGSGQDIIKGVNPGDVLVSDGQSRLKPGSTVQVLTEPPQVVQTEAKP